MFRRILSDAHNISHMGPAKEVMAERIRSVHFYSVESIVPVMFLESNQGLVALGCSCCQRSTLMSSSDYQAT